MVSVLSILVFSGAFAVATMVIVASILPQWRRIVRLAFGNIEPAFTPLQTLANAERRIAVRRWESSAPVAVHRLHEAA